MKKTAVLKHAFAIFFLLIFTFNLGGSYFILRLQQYHLRREIVSQIKNGIPKKELIQIMTTAETKHQLIWKNDEEFRYQGLMYDIVDIETIDQDKTVYYCLSDDKETELIADYHKKIKKNQNDKKHRIKVVKTVKFLQKKNQSQNKDRLTYSQKDNMANFGYYNNYRPIAPEISSPPPKLNL